MHQSSSQRFSDDYQQDTADWDQHYLALDTFGRFFLANIPSEDDLHEASYDWPKLKRAFQYMTTVAFFDFCEDVREEMFRRNNDFRDGLICLPPRHDASLGRNHTRQKLGLISSERFHTLCVQICLELQRRSTRGKGGKIDERKTSTTFSEALSPTDKFTGSSDHLHDLLDNCQSRNYVLSDYDFHGRSFPATLFDHFNSTISVLYSVITSIIQDGRRYSALLSYRGHTAQQILDLLQMLLDHPASSTSMKNSLLSALLQLSSRSGLHPRALALSGVNCGGEPVASGSFGDIWKGDIYGQPVCVKVVKMYQNQARKRARLIEAFAREAIIWGHVSHSNLLSFYGVYHLDEEYGRTCLVSPWMENGNINEYLEKHPSAPRILLLSDIAVGLKYLHGRNIVHGDLKGANILITNTGRACVADFGLSTVLDAAFHSTNSSDSSEEPYYTGGTIRWQAPELFDPSVEYPQASVESDVYAFACVAYEIFTGRRPFYQIPRDITVMYKVMQGEWPSRPPQHDPSFSHCLLPDGIWNLMEECWNRIPSQRPTISQVLVGLPLSGIVDSRPPDDWDEQSASRFRNAVYKSDCLSISVLETVLSWM